MKKKLSAGLIALSTVVLVCGACYAAVIPAQGPGQIGFSSVVLCDSLSLHNDPSSESDAAQTLQYNDRIIVMNQENGWAHVVLGDSEDSPSGYVDASYIAVDPAWYQTDEDTPVYAWNETTAPKVALLAKDTTLPILKDNGEWLIVSLRGATGWINVPGRTQAESSTAANPDTKKTDSANAAGGSTKVDTKNWFAVYSRDGETVSIHFIEGATYEDEKGRTYIKQDEDAFFYCITNDTTYALDPTMWTGEAFGENEFPGEADDEGEAYGENEFPEETDWTGEDYGENQDYTGEDYGENQDLTGEDYGENQDYTGEDYGENEG